MLMTVEQTIEYLVNREYVKYDPVEGSLVWMKIDSKYHQYCVGTKAFYTNIYGGGNDLKLVTTFNGVRVSTWNLIYYITTGNHVIKPFALRPKDGDRMNIKWENIKILNRHEQMAVSLKKTHGRCTNKSGVVGVHWDKRRNKWLVNIRINYRMKFLGRFDSFTDAVQAREEANEKYGYGIRNVKTEGFKGNV
jgi:hypothetical protein